MVIRFAKKEDKKQVLGLIVELTNHVNNLTNKPLITIKDTNSDIFDTLIKRSDVKIFVAEENNILVGLTSLYLVQTIRRKKLKAELEKVIVTKEFRRKGIGKKLLTAALNYCKEHNVYALKLTSSIELTEAHKFYESMGGKFTEKMFRFDIS